MDRYFLAHGEFARLGEEGVSPPPFSLPAALTEFGLEAADGFDRLLLPWAEREKAVHAAHHQLDINRYPRYCRAPYFEQEYVTLIYVHTGCAVLEWAGDFQPLTLETGDLCFVAPRQAHTLSGLTAADTVLSLHLPYESVSACMTDSLPSPDLLSQFLMDRYCAPDRCQPALVISGGNRERLWDILMQLIQEYLEDDLCSGLYISALLQQLMMEILRAYYHATLQQEKLDNPTQVVLGILEDIQRDLSGISLFKVAQQYDIDQSYLSRMVKKRTGHGFNDLVQSSKMQAAARLLRHTDLPLSDVTRLIGYANISYFCKLFKETYHMTPVEYRKRLGSAKFVHHLYHA